MLKRNTPGTPVTQHIPLYKEMSKEAVKEYDRYLNIPYLITLKNFIHNRDLFLLENCQYRWYEAPYTKE
jgi:hypothetical protein